MPLRAQSKANDPSKHADLYVRLSAWPDFNQVAPTPLALEACAMMIGEWVNYEQYNDKLDEGQRKQWRDLIKYLAGSGLLSSKKVTTAPQATTNTERAGGFYSKLKSFLTGKTSR